MRAYVDRVLDVFFQIGEWNIQPGEDPISEPFLRPFCKFAAPNKHCFDDQKFDALVDMHREQEGSL